MMKWMNPVPVYGGDGGGGGGNDGGDQKPDAAAEAAAAEAAAAAAAAGGDDKTGDKVGDKSGADDKGGNFLDNADKLDDKAGDKSKDGDKASWPDDWRDRLAGGDKDFRKLLDRYTSVEEYGKAGREAQKKLSSGKTMADEPMPDPEKEPDKAKEWRKARGIPDDPTGYAIPDTVKNLVTDADKPRLAGFTEAMHKANIPASAAGAAVEWYFQEQEAANAAVALADKADASEVEESLREEWGPDFKPNSQIAKRFAEEVTPGLNWFAARLPDGRTLGNVPDFVKALAEMGRERFGDVSLAGADNTAKTMARKTELENLMRDDPDRYHADPKNSAEYQQIVDAELRAGKKDTGSRHSPAPR